MSFPRYSDYSSSETSWSPSIPSNWKVLPAKRGFNRRKDLNTGMKCGNRLSLTLNGVLPRSLDDLDGLQASEFETYQVFQKDDLVFKLIDLQNIKTSRVGLVHEEGIMSPAYIRLEPNKNLVFPRYAYWFFTDLYKREVFNKLGEGVRQTLGPEELLELPFFYPTLEEQKKIVSFLDNETSKIDSLIAEQEKLIQLLKTKLDTLVLSSFNSSGTTYTRLIHAVEVMKRPVIQQDETLYEPLGLFNRGRGLFHKEHRAKAEMGDSDFHWIKEGDLILSGQFAWEGAVALAYSEEEDCVVSHRYHVLRGRKGVVLTEYLFAMFTTSHGDFLLNESSVGAAGRNRPLNINLLLKEVIPVPDIKTQEKIAVLVLERRNLLREIHAQKKLINERRSALISAAVTGQIDVRNYQAKEAA